MSGVLGAFLRRDFREAVTYKFSFVSSLAGMLLSLATFYFVAKLVPPGSPSLGPFGGDYFSFAVVGVAFSGLLGMFQEGLSAVVRSAQLSGTLEALLVTPVPIPVILFGSSLYSLLFQIFRTALHLAVAAAFFGLAFGRVDVAGVAAVGLLTVVCFLSVGVLSASFILVYKTGNPFSWILGTVSGLLGGVVFPVSLLPPWIRWASSLLPVTYALDGMRKSLLASAPFSAVLPDIAALAVFDVLLVPLSLAAFRLAVRKAKKDGTLSHY
ncbi:MAG TPA: ABC transporter permease [Candidatus Aminicenantes bacterium]|nr:ABC transporter permease [Candidatus Aminicenantes bacterium]HRY64448.1 ABC transporter permease [Candidatus Aminicenantes bacterium]HRZ71361.1 ABC transporter permease [Candidatus Aminicenantes bacterium]